MAVAEIAMPIPMKAFIIVCLACFVASDSPWLVMYWNAPQTTIATAITPSKVVNISMRAKTTFGMSVSALKSTLQPPLSSGVGAGKYLYHVGRPKNEPDEHLAVSVAGGFSGDVAAKTM